MYTIIRIWVLLTVVVLFFTNLGTKLRTNVKQPREAVSEAEFDRRSV